MSDEPPICPDEWDEAARIEDQGGDLSELYASPGYANKSGTKRDVYDSIDAINESVPNITKTIEDAKRDDPDFYEDLRNIFKA